jgi:hypothetical protein
MIHNLIGRKDTLEHWPLNWRDHTVAILAIATVIASASIAHAEVRVNGDVNAIRIDANQSNAAEILSALGSALEVRVHTPIALDRPVSGTFAGSLAQILPRVLDGYNYVIKRQAAITEIVIVGTRGDRAIAVEPPRPPAAPSLAAQWRGLTNQTPPQNR